MYHGPMFRDRPAIETGTEGSRAAEEAIGSIRYIRETMARAESFTAVPGWGGVAMGCVGVVAAIMAWTREDAAEWLSVWLAAAGIAAGIGILSIVRKARRVREPVLAGAGRKFLLGIAPAVFAASVLTMVMYQAGLAGRLPGMWLLMFGVAVVTAGFASIRLIPVMGLLFMLTGTIAFVVPASWGDLLMAVGFGGINIAFGIVIGFRHGG